jgi:hypothetical protein
MTTEQQIQPYPPQADDEITLKELLVKVRAYWDEIRRNWLTVVLICTPFLGWQIYLYYKTPFTYPAKLTFMVNEDQGLSSLSAISGLLGSFGLGGANENNLDRILALSRSNRIIREAILTKVNINNSEDYLGNHFIRIQRLNEEKWKRPPKPPEIWLEGFLFTQADFKNFNEKEKYATKKLIDFIIGAEGIKPVFNASLEKKTGIMTLEANCRSEGLTISLLNTIFNNLSRFYVEKSVEKNQITFNIVKNKADSVLSIMNKTEQREAQFEDKSRGLFLSESQLPSQRLRRDKQTQLLAYAETLKNLELADFALKSNTPYIQVIDTPYTPLKVKKHKLIYVIIIGFGLGVFSGFLYVGMRKFIYTLL